MIINAFKLGLLSQHLCHDVSCSPLILHQLQMTVIAWFVFDLLSHRSQCGSPSGGRERKLQHANGR